MSYKVINSRLNLFDLLTLHLGNQTQEEDHIQNNVTMKEGVFIITAFIDFLVNNLKSKFVLDVLVEGEGV